MSYRVIEHIHGLTDTPDYQRQSTLEDFKNIVMQKATFTDSDYYDFMDGLDFQIWHENKDSFKSVEISNESFNEIEQMYTRIRTWPSKEVYDLWMSLNLAMYEADVDEFYDSKTRTTRSEL